MLVEFSVIPLGKGTHIGDDVARVLEIVEASGLSYQLTPSGTCVEGKWDEVMALLKRCHDRVRETSKRVIWSIRIDDEEGTHDMITRNVLSVEEKVGRTAGEPKA